MVEVGLYEICQVCIYSFSCAHTVCFCVSVLCVSVSIALSLCLSLCVCFCMSLCVSLHVSVCVCLCRSLCVCLFMSLCVCLCLWVCLHVSVYVPASLSLCAGGNDHQLLTESHRMSNGFCAVIDLGALVSSQVRAGPDEPLGKKDFDVKPAGFPFTPLASITSGHNAGSPRRPVDVLGAAGGKPVSVHILESGSRK